MAEVIRMPRLSDTMTEGVIAEWHKKVGDKVKPGDVLAEVETDKATMELESYNEGTLLYIGVDKGKAVQIDGVLAVIGKEGENFDEVLKQAKAPASPTAPVAVQNEKPVSEDKSAPAPADNKTQEGQPDNNMSAEEKERIKASPLAKKLASEKGIDLNAVSGSGDGGRITKKDIDTFQPGKPSTTTIPSEKESYTDTPVSQMRKTIARRLSESKFTAPHFYLTMEIKMDDAIKARERMNAVSSVKISINDMVIKACATALKKHPDVNSSWMGDFIRHNNNINIGSAVAMPEGLIVPVIKSADQKTLSQIAAEAKELYTKAKEKKLQPHEFSGNTFTISNLGMMGIEEFTAIINPPDSCILAVGTIKETVVSVEGQFTTSQIMKVTMSCDHRCVDGAVGASFLQTLKQLMQDPITMLL